MIYHVRIKWLHRLGAFASLFIFILFSGTIHAASKISSILPENAIIGGTADDRVGSGGVWVLPSGNIVIASPRWNDNSGAVTCLTPEEYHAGGIVISAENSLVGTRYDKVGSNGITILSNGNFVVRSPYWWALSYGHIHQPEAGAVTWVNGSTCIPHGETSRGAFVSSTNSIVGSSGFSRVGLYHVFELNNGNYVIRSPDWMFSVQDGGRGAVTWGNGAVGTAGVISAANSLVGSTFGDRVGSAFEVLSNDNYVVGSQNWHNGAMVKAGAVTWGDGEGGTVGVVSSANSLVGSHPYDLLGTDGLQALPNGNYIVASGLWDNGEIAEAGAVTWGNGEGGTVGEVTAANSLVGSTSGDRLGNYGVSILANGHYVVRSPWWDNEAIVNAGAVTWGNGSVGTTGVVSAANSLVGSSFDDQIGFSYVHPLTNGNYVVVSELWDNGTAVDAGAVTWGDGDDGTVGVVSAANSLVGSSASDTVGIGGGAALNNGHYVVVSNNWNSGVGAVTWGDGEVGTVGAVSPANSLVGSQNGDMIYAIIHPLSNGHYVVTSESWDNGSIVDAGAVTWGNGNGGTVGVIRGANSLIGTQEADQVGYYGVELLPNGHYVVRSPFWHERTGAVTWGNGNGGTVGNVRAANSLIGSQPLDFVGAYTVPLTNGHYVVGSPNWKNGSATAAGAVTWANGNGGTVGAVSASNSLVGTKTDDAVGNGGITPLANGHYVVSSLNWNRPSKSNVGAVTWANGNGSTVGAVNSSNSLVGSTVDDQIGDGGITALDNGHYVVTSTLWDRGTRTDVGAVTWANGLGGTVGEVNTANSLVGSTAGDQVGLGEIVTLSDGSYLVNAYHWSHGTTAKVGVVVWSDGLPPVPVPNSNPLLATIGNLTVDEGDTLTFDAEAADADGLAQIHVYSITGGPTGAIFNTETGAFSWTPTESNGGKVFNVTVTVTDDGVPTGSDSEAFTITVNEVNDAPILAEIGNLTVDEGETLTFNADATDVDLPAQNLTYAIEGGPAGASFNTNTGAFSWATTESDGGQQFDVTVTVTDDGSPAEIDTETFTITVDKTNGNPVLAEIGDQTVDEGETLTFDADATDSDMPAQTLTFSITGEPESATFDTASGEFSWTATETDGGQVFNVTVTVTDDGEPTGSDSEAFTITVTEVDESDNQAPVLAEIGNRTGYVGKPLSFVVSATDADLPAQTLTFSLEAGAPDGATIDPVSGLFSWPIDETVTPGDYSVTITVTDDDVTPLNDSETITVTVLQDNFVNNYGFENPGATNKTAAGWNAVKTAKTDQRICNTAQKPVAFEGLCAYRFQLTGTAEPARAIQRKTNSTDFVKGDVLELRGMVKANNLKIGARLILKAVYANKKQTVTYTGVPTGTYDYQPISAQLTLGRVPVKIVVQVKGGKAKGTFFVDDLGVVMATESPSGEEVPQPPDASELRGMD